MTLTVGAPAPTWQARDQDERQHSSADYKGSWALLYFYPKDNTPGCTTEACGLRDAFAEYQKKRIHVLGVSPDSVQSHRKFAEKFGLPFPLLEDADTTIAASFGVWQKKTMYGKEYMGIVRTSFLLDPEGHIAKIYEKVRPEEHAAEVLRDVDALRQGYTSSL